MTKKERNELICTRHEEGYSQEEIGKFYGLSQSRISAIILNKRRGIAERTEETRGVKSRLSEADLQKLDEILKAPVDEENFPYWNKWSVKKIIKDTFGVDYHENYIWKLMAKIGFTSQRPQKKDYRQDPGKVKNFKNKEVAVIKTKAIDENRLLSFQDESAVRLLPCTSTTYAPIGETPVIKCDAKNKAYVSVSGIITPGGKSYFEVRELEGFKQKGLTRFLDNARKSLRKNLLLVWDNAPCHKSKTVKEYLRCQNQENPAIWMANIPPYSPELNPIEQVWAYLKKKLANQFFKTTKELKIAVLNELDKIKKNKKLIKSFFKNKELECYHFFD